ncbi:MAG: FGGY family carbohydrate kinase [Eubacteriales bacterium]|nr:FGGY family carbohydrate kinase [Eubacteriales bacterium]
MRAIGIDIGTTTISIIMIDGENGKLLGSKTIAHKSFQKGPTSASKVQDPEKIWNFTRSGVEEIIAEFGKPDSIGMTGQMHGMLYIDKNGKAVSPLYTWQDGNGNELRKDAATYAETLRAATGSAATGYGLTTHYFLQENDLIPADAQKMVTISDYVAMRLCGEKDPFIAKDMAASWGCYDLEIGDFCKDEMKEVGIDISYLPRILQGHGVIGMTKGNHLPEGIPVSASLGDNQASVLGSVKNLSNTVLVNIGTGSQVSFGTETFLESNGSIELRPCTDKLYLMVGSGLCGGRAYAMLEQFYREITDNDTQLYGMMEKQAREWKETSGKESAWKVRTTFSGTRSNPRERGSITGIGVENFHPGAMTLGMIQGILEELYEMYKRMKEMTGTKAVQLVGSGNGIRQNKLMQELAKELFRLPMDIPECKEEAAYGAALQSLASAGFAESMEQMQQKIRYI